MSSAGSTAMSEPPPRPAPPACRIECTVTPAPLSLDAAFSAVADPSCGGVATFVGTTRATCGGRSVASLAYEAHATMAERVMRGIAADAWEASGKRLAAVYVAHRVGGVDVGAASIIVAASSPHRGEALAAVGYVLDRVKGEAPIWKQ